MATITYGSEAVFESAYSRYCAATFDATNGKIVVAYRDDGNSNYGTACVGSVNPSTLAITWGTPVQIVAAVFYGAAITYDSTNGKVVVAYINGSDNSYGYAVVGTVSGTSISFGTPDKFASTGIGTLSATFDSANEKVVVAYRGASDYITAAVGTVSGTGISFGTPAYVEEIASNYASITYDSTNEKVVVSYQGASDYGTAAVGTVSGTGISFGTPAYFNEATSSYISSTFDVASGKVVVAYTDTGNLSKGTAAVGTVSGTDISFGTPVVFNEAASYYASSTYYASNEKVVVAYVDGGGDAYGETVVGTVSGTGISFEAPDTFDTGAWSTAISITYDSTNKKIVVVYSDAGNNNYGTGIAGELPAPPTLANLKTYNTNIKANIKSINGNLIANVKSLNGNS